MPDEHTNGKPYDDMIEYQRAHWQEVKRTIGLLEKAINAAIADGASLAQQVAGFVQAEERGETPDLHDVARVVAAQDAVVQLLEKLNGYRETIEQHIDALTQIAEQGLFDESVRQFHAQFNTMKEDLL
jgi:hypothetical protein